MQAPTRTWELFRESLRATSSSNRESTRNLFAAPRWRDDRSAKCRARAQPGALGAAAHRRLVLPYGLQGNVPKEPVVSEVQRHMPSRLQPAVRGRLQPCTPIYMHCDCDVIPSVPLNLGTLAPIFCTTSSYMASRCAWRHQKIGTAGADIVSIVPPTRLWAMAW